MSHTQQQPKTFLAFNKILPTELWCIVFSHLDYESIIKIRNTCTFFKNIVKNTIGLWISIKQTWIDGYPLLHRYSLILPIIRDYYTLVHVPNPIIFSSTFQHNIIPVLCDSLFKGTISQLIKVEQKIRINCINDIYTNGVTEDTKFGRCIKLAITAEKNNKIPTRLNKKLNIIKRAMLYLNDMQYRGITSNDTKHHNITILYIIDFNIPNELNIAMQNIYNIFKKIPFGVNDNIKFDGITITAKQL